jgi:hypothetical protein
VPGTDAEYLAVARAVGEYPSSWEDGTQISPREAETIDALRLYLHRLLIRRRLGPQRKAFALLRSLLTKDQTRQLRGGSFIVETSLGNHYRICPRWACTERVLKHGSRWFTVERYCLHDEQYNRMPAGDLAIAHLLLLTCDEPAFLATANARSTRDQLWNPEYLRRMRGRLFDDNRTVPR